MTKAELDSLRMTGRVGKIILAGSEPLSYSSECESKQGQYYDLRLWLAKARMIGARTGPRKQDTADLRICTIYLGGECVGEFFQPSVGKYRGTGAPKYTLHGYGYIDEDYL